MAVNSLGFSAWYRRGSSYEDKSRLLKMTRRSKLFVRHLSSTPEGLINNHPRQHSCLSAWCLCMIAGVLNAKLSTGFPFRQLTSLYRRSILLIGNLPLSAFFSRSVENALSKGFSQQNKASHSWQHNYPAM